MSASNVAWSRNSFAPLMTCVVVLTRPARAGVADPSAYWSIWKYALPFESVNSGYSRVGTPGVSMNAGRS
jgi:hypothetical protein